MIRFEWSETKNALLLSKTGVSFDDVEAAIAQGDLLADVSHPNQALYSHQRILIVKVHHYAVPYVEQEDGSLFLKTLYPSRKFR